MVLMELLRGMKDENGYTEASDCYVSIANYCPPPSSQPFYTPLEYLEDKCLSIKLIINQILVVFMAISHEISFKELLTMCLA